MRTAATPTKQVWHKYTALVRRFCDICLVETPLIQGVPKHSINRAVYTEDGPYGRMWLCAAHKADRSAKVDAENALMKRAEKADAGKRKPRSKG